MEDILTDKRAIKNRFDIHSDDVCKYVLPTQFRCSKSITNQAIYAQRQWFSIHSIFFNHLYNLIPSDEALVKQLSTNDKITFLNYAIKKRDCHIIGILLAYLRIWEFDAFTEIELMIYQTFTKEEIFIIDNAVPPNFYSRWNFMRSPKINYSSSPDYKSIINLINQIKTCNFVTKFNSLEEFMELMKSSFKQKFNNQIATKKKQDKVITVYKKALVSLQKYPLQLNSGKEAMMLEGIGESTAQKIDQYLKRNGIESNLPLDENKNKKNSNFSPKYKSAPWALLVGLYRGTKDKENLTKDELIEISTPLSDVSMKPQFSGGKISNFYTGWSSMKSLLEKELIQKNGKPQKFSLTENGIKLAKKLSNGEKIMNKKSSE